MKIGVLIARILLGLMFTLFGLNGFLNFLPSPPMSGDAGTFLGVLVSTHYSAVIFAVQLIAGLLMLAGQFIPLALILLAPEIVNILTFHVTMAPSGIGPGVLAAILWVIVAYWYRASLAPLFAQKPRLL